MCSKCSFYFQSSVAPLHFLPGCKGAGPNMHKSKGLDALCIPESLLDGRERWSECWHWGAQPLQNSDMTLQVAVALAKNLSSLELCPRKTLAPSLWDWCPSSPSSLVKDAVFLPRSLTNRLNSLTLSVSQQWHIFPSPVGWLSNSLLWLAQDMTVLPGCLDLVAHRRKRLFYK